MTDPLKPHRYLMLLSLGDLHLELVSDDLEFITTQTEQWFQRFVDPRYHAIKAPSPLLLEPPEIGNPEPLYDAEIAPPELNTVDILLDQITALQTQINYMQHAQDSPTNSFPAEAEAPLDELLDSITEDMQQPLATAEKEDVILINLKPELTSELAPETPETLEALSPEPHDPVFDALASLMDPPEETLADPIIEDLFPVSPEALQDETDHRSDPEHALVAETLVEGTLERPEEEGPVFLPDKEAADFSDTTTALEEDNTPKYQAPEVAYDFGIPNEPIDVPEALKALSLESLSEIEVPYSSPFSDEAIETSQKDLEAQLEEGGAGSSFSFNVSKPLPKPEEGSSWLEATLPQASPSELAALEEVRISDIESQTKDKSLHISPKLDELKVSSLRELLDLALHAASAHDRLLITGYFLSRYGALEKYTLKDINGLLIRAGETPVNHGILEAVLSEGLMRLSPDLAGMAQVAEYTLSNEGELKAMSMIVP
jgi:hypothetical protein